jgi:hypothetical protein
MTPYHTLTIEQLIARLQIADSELKRERENNIQLHRMIEVLREQGWSTPRPADNRRINIRDYPMPGAGVQQDDRVQLAKKVGEANERADHWRKKYMDLLDSTGRPRGN